MTAGSARRATDGPLTGRLYRLSRWQGPIAVISMLVTVLVASWLTLGFGFPTTPRSQFVTLAARVDSADLRSRAADASLRAAVDSVRAEHAHFRQAVRILAVDACLRLRPAEWQRMQLACPEYLKPPNLLRGP